MHDNISYLYSDKPHNTFAEPDSPIQVERVREWSGIERTVNNHLLMGLGAARRQAQPKKKQASACDHSASSHSSHGAAGIWSHG